MGLTTHEIRAILETANYWQPAGWGLPNTGLGPAAVVATGRGARFHVERDGLLYPDVDGMSPLIAGKAWIEVAAAMRLSQGEYLRYLWREGPAILKRLVHPPPPPAAPRDG